MSWAKLQQRLEERRAVASELIGKYLMGGDVIRRPLDDTGINKQ